MGNTMSSYRRIVKYIGKKHVGMGKVFDTDLCSVEKVDIFRNFMQWIFIWFTMALLPSHCLTPLKKRKKKRIGHLYGHEQLRLTGLKCEQYNLHASGHMSARIRSNFSCGQVIPQLSIKETFSPSSEAPVTVLYKTGHQTRWTVGLIQYSNSQVLVAGNLVRTKPPLQRKEKKILAKSAL